MMLSKNISEGGIIKVAFKGNNNHFCEIEYKH